MFFLLIILVFLLAIIKFRLKDGLSKLVGFSFVLYWFGSLIISMFHPQGLYAISSYAYFLLSLGGVSFVAGLSLIEKKNNHIPDTKASCIYYTEKIATNVFFLAFLFALTIYFLLFIKEAIVYSEIMGRAARVNNGDELYSDNKLFVYVYDYIGSICFHLCNVLFWECILNFKKKYILPLIIILGFILSYGFLNGGRQIIIISIIYFAFLYFYNHNYKVRFSFKSIILTSLLVGVALYGIAVITSYRSYGTYVMDKEEVSEGINSAGEKIINYSVLPGVLFDRSLKSNYYEKLDGPYYGRATFSGLDTWLWVVLRYFSDYQPTSQTVVRYVQDNYYPVSGEQEANYAYTALFYHYMDFGIFGIVLFPFIFGYIFRKIIMLYYESGSLSILVLLGFFYYITLHSMFTCYLIKGWTIFYISGLYLIYYLKRARKFNRNRFLMNNRIGLKDIESYWLFHYHCHHLSYLICKILLKNKIPVLVHIHNHNLQI